MLAQTGEAMARMPVGSGELRRLAGAALVPYHAGRAVTYILLAVLLSLQLMARLPALRWIPAAALLLGAALFLLLDIRGLRGLLETGLLAALASERGLAASRDRCSQSRGAGAESASACCWVFCLAVCSMPSSAERPRRLIRWPRR